MGNRSDFHPTQLNSILLYTCLGEEFATWTAGVFSVTKIHREINFRTNQGKRFFTLQFRFIKLSRQGKKIS
jgi:hypothetical protein